MFKDRFAITFTNTIPCILIAAPTKHKGSIGRRIIAVVSENGSEVSLDDIEKIATFHRILESSKAVSLVLGSKVCKGNGQSDLGDTEKRVNFQRSRFHFRIGGCLSAISELEAKTKKPFVKDGILHEGMALAKCDACGEKQFITTYNLTNEAIDSVLR